MPGRSRSRRLAEWLVLAATFVVPFSIYLAGWRYLGSGDTQPAELLPRMLWLGHGFDFASAFPREAPLPYGFRRMQGRVVSTYPIVSGLLNAPVHFFAMATGMDGSADSNRLSLVSAAAIAALSVAFLHLALIRLFRSRSTALLMAAAYAFGTCVWSVASRAMWQHGPSLLFQSVAIWLLAIDTDASIGWSGLPLGLAIVNRPMNVLVALPLAIAGWRRRPAALWRLGAAVLLPLAARAVYAEVYWGNALSQAQADPVPAIANFGGNPFVGLAGLLVSPSRGLLVFSPFFFIVALSIRPAWRLRREQPLFVALLSSVLLVIVVTSKWTIWWGGHTFGYRLLIEVLPALTVLSALAWEQTVRAHLVPRTAFAVCVLWSVSIHGLGTFAQPTGFNQKMDEDPRVLWSFRDSDIAMTLAKARAAVRR
ncbi:MAG TPA: hypothetical protein VH854_11005 [Thermoanaerobaculia bacterium]|nr:hypothetical protein [Thermoanaerobaculia bacterium]